MIYIASNSTIYETCYFPDKISETDNADMD